MSGRRTVHSPRYRATQVAISYHGSDILDKIAKPKRKRDALRKIIPVERNL